MRVGRILLLGLFVSGLGISTAFAQPADDRAVYADDATNGYKRVDKTTPANISYQTVNKTLPYYVAPSTLSHPALALPRNVLVFNPADLHATWKWEENGTSILTLPAGPQADNKADITVNAMGTANVEVVEVSADCGDGAMSKMQIIGTSAPKIEIADAEVVGAIGLTTVDETTPATVIAAAQGLKGKVFKSCDNTKFAGKQIKLTLKSTENGLPVSDANLRKYSFSINYVIYRHKSDGTYTIDGGNTVAEDHPSNAKVFVDGNTGSDFTINIPAITAPNAALNEDYVDVIFYLSGSENRTGVVSSISHRSDNPLAPGFTVASLTNYDYDKTNDNLCAVVRLTDKPKTGPIYHIPYNY